MKEFIGIIIGLIIINSNIMSQNTEYYTLDEAIQNKENAISLFLNYNFQEVKPITNSISELVNLEEFRIFPRWFDFPKIENKKVVCEKIDNCKSKTPNSIPHITKCQNLKLIDISNSEIKALPTDLESLTNLEILILNYSQIKLSNEYAKIMGLKNIKEIHLVGIEIDNDLKSELEKKPELKIIASIEDFKDQINEDEQVDVQMHDTYMVFQNEKQANRFINSIPHGLAKNAKKYKRGNR